MKLLSCFVKVVPFVALLIVGGCSRPGYMKDVAPVTGHVTLDGKPVTEGYVTFTPQVTDGADPLNSGKAASGTIGSDGKFVLTTYGNEDGAVVGRHSVTFFRPDPEDDEQLVMRNRFIPGGKSVEVEVLPEPNEIQIDLHRKGEATVTRGS